jgi:hypothetical protein
MRIVGLQEGREYSALPYLISIPRTHQVILRHWVLSLLDLEMLRIEICWI